MKILITGGSGFLATALASYLLEHGHSVWALTRLGSRARLPGGVIPVQWDGESTTGWLDVFAQMDGVVNLAGATIGSWPWTAGRKEKIRRSRIRSGELMLQAFNEAARRPSVLIQASGVGYYGFQDEEPVTEQTGPGDDFLARLAVDWEASSAAVAGLGVRRAVIRQAVVLDAHKGIMPLVSLPARLFFGGRLGRGTQGFPWIHKLDHIRAIHFLLENEQAYGAFNLAAPEMVSSEQFLAGLVGVLGRPYWFHVPEFLMRVGLGEMSALLLEGQYVKPERLLQAGFQFRYPFLQDALVEIYPRN